MVYDIIDMLRGVEGFEWDLGNFTKNQTKHKISAQEAEEVFVNAPLFFNRDIEHSILEDRWLAFGLSNEHKFLTIAFTIRKKKIRIIMARPMGRKERSWYHAQEKESK